MLNECMKKWPIFVIHQHFKQQLMRDR
uniref:Uncharacterized protein n=1 Tax=Anguilla anguilla TaxID=7936 RepID=A0A0E9VUY0_ANGAN